MKYYKKIIKKNWKEILIYFILGLILSFLTNYSASYYEKLIDSFSIVRSDLTILFVYSCLLIFVCVLSYIEQKPEQEIYHNIYYDFKICALEKISKISYIDYCKINTGSLIQKIENGAEAGKKIICDFYLCVFRELVPSVIFSIYFIWKIDQRITYIILGSYILVFFITNYLLKMLYRIKENILINEEEINHFLVRGLMEMVVFRLYNYFESEQRKATAAKKIIVKNRVKMTMIHEAFFSIFAFFVVLIKIGVLLYGALTEDISIGSIVALIMLIDNAYTPIAIFNVLFVEYKLDKVSFQRYKNFLSLEDDERLTKDNKQFKDIFPINIKSLGFSFENRKVLKNISLKIEKGEKIAFVGESGSGKSTLIKILAGLLKCDDCMIYIGDIEFNSINLNDYYKKLSFVPQDSSIFSGSIQENILLNIGNVEKLSELKEELQLGQFFSQLEDGDKTKLGEKGIRLSGGEKQKVALSRLWIKESDFILLDESTSAMDNISEDFMMKNIITKFNDKTIISVMHRLNCLKYFDRIIVFKEGEIVGDGGFEGLMADNEYFRTLYANNKKI